MNPTFQRLRAAELARTGSPARAATRAGAVYGALAMIAAGGKSSDAGFSPATYYRHKRALARAGLCPLESPADLAQLARDLNISDTDSLARLLWTLQTSKERSLPKVVDHWSDFIEEAQRVLFEGAPLDITEDEATVH